MNCLYVWLVIKDNNKYLSMCTKLDTTHMHWINCKIRILNRKYVVFFVGCANFPATLQTYCLTCIDAGQKPLPKLPDFLQNKIQNLNEPTQDSADNTPVMDDDDDFKPSTSKRKAKKPIPILKSAKVVKKDTKYTMKKASAILMETKVPAERMEPFLCENIVEPSPPRIKSPPRIPSPTRTPSPTITPSPTRTPSHTRTPSPQPTTSHPVPETIENLVRTPTTSSHGTTTFECPDANMDDASYSEYQHAGFSTPPLEIDLDERFTPPIPDSPSSVHFSPEPRCDL